MHEGFFEITLTVLLIRRWVPSSPTQLKEAEENLVKYIQTPSEGESIIIVVVIVIVIVVVVIIIIIVIGVIVVV